MEASSHSQIGGPVADAHARAERIPTVARDVTSTQERTREDARAVDDRLMAALGEGEIEALEGLYDRYSILVYSVALRILRDQVLAEDVTQEVFLRLWRRPQSYDPARGRFVSWLMSITAQPRDRRAAPRLASAPPRGDGRRCDGHRSDRRPARRSRAGGRDRRRSSSRARRHEDPPAAAAPRDRAGLLRRPHADGDRRAHIHAARHRQDARQARHEQAPHRAPRHPPLPHLDPPAGDGQPSQDRA